VGDWKRRAITDAGRVVEGTDPKVRASGPDPLVVAGGDRQPAATIVSPCRGEWLWNYDADAAFEEALASSTLRARAV
jgi:hypothetical protein